MAEEMGDIRAQVLEQGLALQEMRREPDDAEQRHKSSHAELIGMMQSLLLRTKEQEARLESGREQQMPSTEVTAKGAAGTPPSESSEGGSGSRQDGRAPVDAEPGGGRFDGEGQQRGVAPSGEFSRTHGGGGFLGGRQQFLGPKMNVPMLKGRENFDTFKKQMRVYTKVHGFETVFDSDAYVEGRAEGNDRESLMAQGVTGRTYEIQLMAWVFLSQALQSNVDKSTFHRSKSPRQCWVEIVQWYDTKTNAQKGSCMKQLYKFKIGKDDNPVERLYEIEDLRVKLMNAGLIVDDNTMYSCFVDALPVPEYDLEIWDLNLKQIFDRKEILNLVRSLYEVLIPSFGKRSSHSHAIVAKGGRGHGGRGEKGWPGRGKEGGDRSKHGEAGKTTCWRCRGLGHFADACTAKLCDRCGGRGHHSSVCTTPEGEEAKSPQEAVLAMVGGAGSIDDDLEVAAF